MLTHYTAHHLIFKDGLNRPPILTTTLQTPAVPSQKAAPLSAPRKRRSGRAAPPGSLSVSHENVLLLGPSGKIHTPCKSKQQLQSQPSRVASCRCRGGSQWAKAVPSAAAARPRRSMHA